MELVPDDAVVARLDRHAVQVPPQQSSRGSPTWAVPNQGPLLSALEAFRARPGHGSGGWRPGGTYGDADDEYRDSEDAAFPSRELHGAAAREAEAQAGRALTLPLTLTLTPTTNPGPSPDPDPNLLTLTLTLDPNRGAGGAGAGGGAAQLRGVVVGAVARLPGAPAYY